MDEKKLEKLLRRYEAATKRLVEADRELVRERNDQYVTWEWVCWYLNVSRETAEKLLADQPISVFTKGVERFLRSTIVGFAEHNTVKVYERALVYLTKAPKQKADKTRSKSIASDEEIRAMAERGVMNFLANTNKRIERREAWEEKQKLKGKKLNDKKK